MGSNRLLFADTTWQSRDCANTGETMNALRQIPMATLAIIVGTVTAIAWVTVAGTVALVISIAGGGLIAVRATLLDGEE